MVGKKPKLKTKRILFVIQMNKERCSYMWLIKFEICKKSSKTRMKNNLQISAESRDYTDKKVVIFKKFTGKREKRYRWIVKSGRRCSRRLGDRKNREFEYVAKRI